MVVGGAQCFDIASPQLTDVMEAAAAPAEGVAPQPSGQKVCHQPRVAPVPVWKGMDRHEAVMQAHGDLVRCIGSPAVGL